MVRPIHFYNDKRVLSKRVCRATINPMNTPENSQHRFRSIGQVLKDTFHEKIVKLSIDGGFTCPNRDGTKGYGGCTFCSASGSGEFTSGRHLSIAEQMKQQVELLSPKWKQAKYIAYFQNFTNTYADVHILRKKYDEALSFPGTVGLSIATRPDCLESDVLDLLVSYHKRTYLWVELGIQTIHENIASAFRRGYRFSEMEDALNELKKRGIRTVAHTMANLPGESKEDFLKTVQYLVEQDIWGIKIHMTNVLRNTQLAVQFAKESFPVMTRDEYITLVCDALELLSPETVVHRLTGDGSKDDLIAPLWICDKRAVLNGIQKEMRRRQSFQGIHFADKKNGDCDKRNV